MARAECAGGRANGFRGREGCNPHKSPHEQNSERGIFCQYIFNFSTRVADRAETGEGGGQWGWRVYEGTRDTPHRAREAWLFWDGAAGWAFHFDA